MTAILDLVNLSGSDVTEADFFGASFLGANLSDLLNADTASWQGAIYDADTIFDSNFDLEGLVYVPEPDANLALLAGVVTLALLRRRRIAECR